MDLLLIEVLHLVRCYYLIIVQVNDLEPVLHAADGCLVLLAQHEPDEVLVVHFVLRRALEAARNLVEYTVNGFAR